MRIGGIEPLSLCDYPGTPAVVLFTQGCNWRCSYCHNRSLLPREGPEVVRQTDLLDLLRERRSRLDGVVVTGGEPTVQSDLLAFLVELKGMGFRVKLDTNGSRPEVVYRLMSRGCVDYIAMDIKAPWLKYGMLAGREDVDVESVRECARLIGASTVPHHFRTTWSERLLSKDDIATIKQSLPAGAAHVVQVCREQF